MATVIVILTFCSVVYVDKMSELLDSYGEGGAQTDFDIALLFF